MTIFSLILAVGDERFFSIYLLSESGISVLRKNDDFSLILAVKVSNKYRYRFGNV
ncbi:hypothetical protein [Okeania sp. KiyG1]|uniref:hypothetical protein n=1 Tax=Okeania sp. KiyG1 TaxID=2720165 RepID=UPI001922D3A9|nr:hypothetical protein [Okeania sp. KiyG1]